MVVFGAYSTWTFSDPSSPLYCAYPPFMCALVLLCMTWSSLAICLCCLCLCGGAGLCVVAILRFTSPSSDSETQPQIQMA